MYHALEEGTRGTYHAVQSSRHPSQIANRFNQTAQMKLVKEICIALKSLQ